MLKLDQDQHKRCVAYCACLWRMYVLEETMPPTTKNTAATDVETVISSLERLATKKTRDGMARYAIPSDNAFGVAMADIQKLGKQIGVNHKLAGELWKSGWYEARTLSAFVEDPALVTPAQMDSWCRDFDNWAICDTLCFKLFDRVPHAYKKVEQWSKSREEFVKRAAFALLASLALHDRSASNDAFLRLLPLIEKCASDERNFVWKGVSWALRSIGTRNSELKSAANELAERLAKSTDVTARRIGKEALKQFTVSKR
jgi:3-methyladenine DNA glycosylase AlkD